MLHLQPKTPHSLSPLPSWATIHYLIFHLPFQEEFVYEGDHRKAASQMSSLSQSSPFLTISGPNHSLIYHHPGDKNPYVLLIIQTLLARPAELERAQSSSPCRSLIVNSHFLKLLKRELLECFAWFSAGIPKLLLNAYTEAVVFSICF